MCVLGAVNRNILSSDWYDEEAAHERAERINKWKAEQPDFIAVKMTNAEIVEVLCLENGNPILKNIHCENNILPGEEYKLIHNELYKKVPNPKNYCDQFQPVIPWED